MSTDAYERLSSIDFSDGHPTAVAWDGWTLLLDYENWKEETLRLKFTGVAYVSGVGGGASLCEANVSVGSAEIERVQEKLAQDWGTWDRWKDKTLTQLVIAEDVPLLTIVFEDVEITKLRRPADSIAAKFTEFDKSDS